MRLVLVDVMDIITVRDMHSSRSGVVVIVMQVVIVTVLHNRIIAVVIVASTAGRSAHQHNQTSTESCNRLAQRYPLCWIIPLWARKPRLH
jgi:hypothetical protein